VGGHIAQPFLCIALPPGRLDLHFVSRKKVFKRQGWQVCKEGGGMGARGTKGGVGEGQQ
jgi:hypothetical protein